LFLNFVSTDLILALKKSADVLRLINLALEVPSTKTLIVPFWQL